MKQEREPKTMEFYQITTFDDMHMRHRKCICVELEMKQDETKTYSQCVFPHPINSACSDDYVYFRKTLIIIIDVVVWWCRHNHEQHTSHATHTTHTFKYTCALVHMGKPVSLLCIQVFCGSKNRYYRYQRHPND